MKPKSIGKNIAISLLFGFVVAVVDWLLQYTVWFHQESYHWWRSVTFGCAMALIWFFVIIPLNNKEKSKHRTKTGGE